MNTNKEELVRNLQDVVRGFEGHETFFDVPFIDHIKYFPEENIRKMLSIDVKSCKSLGQAYEKWGRANAISFRPYILEDVKIPTLCIKWNRFMHLEYYKHFQISSTPNEKYYVGNNTYPFDFLLRYPFNSGDVVPRMDLADIVWWSAVIDAGILYDNFRTELRENQETIMMFIDRVKAYYVSAYYKSTARINCVTHYMSEYLGNIDYLNDSIYAITDKQRLVRAYIKFTHDSIKIELPENTLLIMKIPRIRDSYLFDNADKDGVEECEFAAEELSRSNFINHVVTFALNYGGIHLTHSGCIVSGHFADKRVRVKNADVPTISNSSELSRCLREYYK